MPAVLLSLLCAGCLVSLGDLRMAAPAAVAVMLVWGATVVLLPMPRWGRIPLLVCAVAVRTVMLASPATLSDDVYRYLWEGQVVAVGGNPYLHPPADVAWMGFEGDPILGLVAHPEIGSVYPPLALWIFGALATIVYHPVSIKVAMGLCDALAVMVLGSILRGRKRRLDAAWLYALHPLGVVESAGSGHVEALAILLLLMAIRDWDRGRSGLGWASLGALVKLFPVVLVPALWRRSPWLLVAAGVLGMAATAPLMEAGPAMMDGFMAYTAHWSFNGAIFQVTDSLLGIASRPVLILAGAVVVVLALKRFRDPARIALWAGGAFVLLSPTVHPWYVAWAWLPALICGVRAWTVFATLVPVSYVVLASYDPASSTWTETWWPAWVQLLPFLGVLLWEYLQRTTRPGPWAPGAARTR